MSAWDQISLKDGISCFKMICIREANIWKNFVLQQRRTLAEFYARFLNVCQVLIVTKKLGLTKRYWDRCDSNAKNCICSLFFTLSPSLCLGSPLSISLCHTLFTLLTRITHQGCSLRERSSSWNSINLPGCSGSWHGDPGDDMVLQRRLVDLRGSRWVYKVLATEHEQCPHVSGTQGRTRQGTQVREFMWYRRSNNVFFSRLFLPRDRVYAPLKWKTYLTWVTTGMFSSAGEISIHKNCTNIPKHP